MVVAFVRKNNEDVIMLEGKKDYVVQQRVDLCPVFEHVVKKPEGKDVYEEAENVFISLADSIGADQF